MAHRYNIHLIKGRASYSPSEIAKLLGIDRKTCSRWMKEGLKVIEKNTTPLLVMGEDLKAFITQKQARRRTTLAVDEYLCMKCHKPVKSRPENEQIIKTGKKIGKGWEQRKKIGLCEHCGTKLNKLIRPCQED